MAQDYALRLKNFMLISAKHEICPANYHQITNNCSFCFWLKLPETEVLFPISMKISTILKSFIFIRRNISCSAELSMKHAL